MPENEILGYRCYPEIMDITNLVVEGENTIAIMLGNSWYTDTMGMYRTGNKKSLLLNKSYR